MEYTVTFTRRGWRNLRHSGASIRGSMEAWRIMAILLALLATSLFILSVGVYYAYIPSSEVGNLTYGELGVFGFVAGAGAVFAELAGRR